MAGSIKAMQQWAEQIEAANTGYDQNQRWTFLDRANRRLRPNREADCSSVVAAIVWLAGYPINISGECWTGNLGELLKDAGWKVCRFKELSQVRAGDVLIAPRHHTEFAYTANKWYSAHIDESGHPTGGKGGNRTGGETKFRKAYIRPGGWTYLARPPADAAGTLTPAASVLRQGDKGSAVKAMQRRLINVGISVGPDGADGNFGPNTKRGVITLQTRAGFTGEDVDGKFGPKTDAALKKIEQAAA
jgi:Putative peptidoglycan binding domain